MKNSILMIATAASLAAMPLSAASAAQKTRLGGLECTVAGGVGLLVGSSKKVTCTFKEAKGGDVERYTGRIGKVGLDIGVSGKSYIKWVVVTPQGTKVGQHALAGSYVGVSAGGALGIGLGANALVGGQSKHIGLQPLSVQGNSGLNVAVGVSKLTLQPAS